MNRSILLIVILSFSISTASDAQETVEIIFGAGFSTSLADVASDAGINAFSAGEISSIESGVKSQLESMYGAFGSTSFSLTGGSGTTILDFGAMTTDGNGLLGVSSLDFGNLANDLGSTTIASVYSHNFDFVVNEFSGGTSRATQISQLTTALAGTGGHELGHSFGLQHHQSYGTPGITPANYGATGALQNAHVMATGSTGLGEIGRETTRIFSKWSNLMLEATGGFDASTFGVTGDALASTVLAQTVSDVTSGDVGDTTGTATSMALAAMPISGFDAAHIAGRLGSASDVDVYSFTASGPGTVSAEAISDFRYSDDFNSFLTLYDTDGTTILFTNDDARYDGNVFNSGTLRSLDGFFSNISLDFAGTYFVEVSSVGATSGPGSSDGLYSLVLGFSATAIPEPTSMMLFLFGLGTLASRNRYYRR